jgi:hypothetical protein
MFFRQETIALVISDICKGDKVVVLRRVESKFSSGRVNGGWLVRHGEVGISLTISWEMSCETSSLTEGKCENGGSGEGCQSAAVKFNICIGVMQERARDGTIGSIIPR